MNHPHDPLFRWLSLIIAFSIGLAFGGWAFSAAPKPAPIPLTEGQLAGAVPQTAADFNRHVARVCPNAGLPSYQDGSIVPQTDMLRCITSASLATPWRSLFSTPSNREGQTPTVSPQPYVLHPDKTPLTDPTQADYYRKLLEQGRFPVSGSAEGRPR